MADNLVVAGRAGAQDTVSAKDDGTGVLRIGVTQAAPANSIGFMQPNGVTVQIGTVQDANGVHTICTK